MDEILSAFVTDAHELLTVIEGGLLRLEAGEQDKDTLNAVFRAAHTIKGDAGVVDLHHIEQFTHTLENSLDNLRRGDIQASPAFIGLLLEAADYIRIAISRVERGDSESDPSLEAAAASIIGRLRTLTGAPDTFADAPPPQQPSAAPETLWRITVRFGTALVSKGIDPLDVLRYLASFGHFDRLSPAISLTDDRETRGSPNAPLDFEIDFRTAADRAQIEQAFELVRDDCELQLIQLDTPADGTSPENGDSAQQEAPAALQNGPQRTGDTRQIRVQADKLDLLITMVGELVISAASASAKAQRTGQTELLEANAGVARLVEGLRELSLQLRMVPIGDTFARMRRTVRDLAQGMSRDVELVVRGEDTELDKTVAEKVGDPLMHLIRNAIDHGIEPAAERRARGKPAKGRVELNAWHEAGGVVIEVADDGGGLDREKILTKAIEHGMVTPGETLADQQIFNLIFEAGFSTADKVTNVSGRGVGMDVVRSNVSALRGVIDVHSEPGQGTRFIMHLPVTMAIIDGFLVAVGGAYYVIPLERVVECTELHDEYSGRDLFDLRGEMLSCIRLRSLFGASGTPPQRENVVVVRHGSEKSCLIVDALHGECQSVIKPLSPVFSGVRGIAGATILGSGEVALILDVRSLIQLGRDAEQSIIEEPHYTASSDGIPHSA